MKTIRRIALTALIVILAATMAGCVNIYEQDDEGADSVEQISTDTPEASTEGDSDDIVSGIIGTFTTLGSWTVTAVEAEFDPPYSDGLTVDEGERLLMIELELTNEGTLPARVQTRDWTLVDSEDVTYEVLPVDDPDRRGERNIPHGKTEDVKVYFAVPESSSGFILSFTPEQGGPGTLEVPVP